LPITCRGSSGTAREAEDSPLEARQDDAAVEVRDGVVTPCATSTLADDGIVA
jgi:hypothetical protein